MSDQPVSPEHNKIKERTIAVLNESLGCSEKVAQHIKEWRQKGGVVLPPDINASQIDFSGCTKGIRYGLGAIRGISIDFVDAIVRTRETSGWYENLKEFLNRIDICAYDKDQLWRLIMSGALMPLCLNRKALFEILYNQSLFDDITSLDHDPDIPDFSPNEILFYEESLLGYYISRHPLNEMEPIRKGLKTISLKDLRCHVGTEVNVIGVISKLNVKEEHNLYEGALGILEDQDTSIAVFIPPTVLHMHLHDFIQGSSWENIMIAKAAVNHISSINQGMNSSQFSYRLTIKEFYGPHNIPIHTGVF